ncbi:hypothetical protein PF004_g23348 [Phytophthora fragariae]|uniref:Uncharacterized protein n=1 Tax=Phytophthora fragariae TaxID=53985 RepID=A0A6G0MXD1_9STRA|nr:hypothetical protein PF004_g23348 [Phytophthora fragariae]
MVDTIPQAVAVLLYKNMHLPIEDVSDFGDGLDMNPATEDTLMQQMLSLLQQTQEFVEQRQQEPNL